MNTSSKRFYRFCGNRIIDLREGEIMRFGSLQNNKNGELRLMEQRRDRFGMEDRIRVRMEMEEVMCLWH